MQTSRTLGKVQEKAGADARQRRKLCERGDNIVSARIGRSMALGGWELYKYYIFWTGCAVAT